MNMIRITDPEIKLHFIHREVYLEIGTKTLFSGAIVPFKILNTLTELNACNDWAIYVYPHELRSLGIQLPKRRIKNVTL